MTQHLIRVTGPLGTRFYAGCGAWAKTPNNAYGYKRHDLAERAARSMGLPFTHRVVPFTPAEESEDEIQDSA